MTPIRNQVLVKPFPSDEISKGGIIIPESLRKPSHKVKVVAVGNGTAKRKMTLKKGDTAYRVRDWGLEVLIDGDLHFIMDMDAIIALN